MRVVVGQYDLDNEDNEEMIFNIEDVHIHHKWNNKIDKSDAKHDIALIKIRRKGDGSGIELDGKSGLVRPACLPSQNANNERNSNTCSIAGWGNTEKKLKEKNGCLRSANVPIMSNKKCKNIFQKSNSKKRISEGLITIGY